VSAREKYESLINLAHDSGASEVEAQEENGVLHVRAVVPTNEAKDRLWAEYERIDPGRQSGDLQLKVEVTGTGLESMGGGGGETYTVQRGDTLSEIGQRLGVGWRDIFEANRDQLNDPDKIQPGQNLRIPRK
jgi:nucleoid-associated protein YgaU